jgi:uncharacterized protein YlxW (UPF0749 family)
MKISDKVIDKNNPPEEYNNSSIFHLSRISSVLLSILLVLFGITISISIRSYVESSEQNSALNLRLSNYRSQMQSLTEENEILLAENESLANKKNLVSEDVLKAQGFDDLAVELSEVRRLAGLTEVKGAGVSITLNDSTISDASDTSQTGIIHSQDVFYVVELLKSLGADAIDINGERIVNTTVITCLGPTIRVNNARHPVPFVISAICNSEDFLALMETDEYIQYRITSGVSITVTSVPDVTIPAFYDVKTVDSVYSLLKEDKK